MNYFNRIWGQTTSKPSPVPPPQPTPLPLWPVPAVAGNSGAPVTHASLPYQSPYPPRKPGSGMMIVSAKGPTVKGGDMYHGNTENFADLKARGYTFIAHKASDGKGFQDDKFHARWPILKSYGFVRIAYHFFQPSEDPYAQADNFIGMVEGLLEPGDMIMFDWECRDSTPNSSNRDRAFQFLGKVQSVLKKIPIIYADVDYIETRQPEERFAAFPLWIAEPGVKAPKIYPPWSTWVLFQTGDEGIDTDLFNGDLPALKALALSLNT